VSINNLGGLFWSTGRFSEAEPYWREAMEKFRRLHGQEHPSTLTATLNLGALLRVLGRITEAEPLVQDAMEKRRSVLGEEHADTLAAILQFGMLRVQQGRYGEAIAVLAPAEALFRSTFTGGNQWRVAAALTTLGRARVGLGFDADRFRQAESELLEAHAIFVRTRGAVHAETISCVQGLVDLYIAWETQEPGNGYAAMADEWRARLHGGQ